MSNFKLFCAKCGGSVLLLLSIGCQKGGFQGSRQAPKDSQTVPSPAPSSKAAVEQVSRDSAEASKEKVEAIVAATPSPSPVAPALPASKLKWDGKVLIGTSTMALIPTE